MKANIPPRFPGNKYVPFLLIVLLVLPSMAKPQLSGTKKLEILFCFEPNMMIKQFRYFAWDNRRVLDGYVFGTILFGGRRLKEYQDQDYFTFSAGLRAEKPLSLLWHVSSGILYLHESYPVFYNNNDPHTGIGTYDLDWYFASYIRVPLGININSKPSKKKGIVRSFGMGINLDFLFDDRVYYMSAPSRGPNEKYYPLILDRLVPEISYSRKARLYKNLYMKRALGFCFDPWCQRAHHEFILTNYSLCFRAMLEYKGKNNKP